MKVENMYDIVGQFSGQLEILDYLGYYNRAGRIHHVYLTKCSCGTTKAIRRDSLLSNRSRTCGHTNGRIDVGIPEKWRKEHEE